MVAHPAGLSATLRTREGRKEREREGGRGEREREKQRRREREKRTRKYTEMANKSTHLSRHL